MTELTCTAQVGSESAFDGSEWGGVPRESSESANAPAAVSKTNVPSAAAGDAGAERSKSADLVDSSKAARSSEAPFASARSASAPFACRLDSNALLANPKAKRKLDTVSRLSEAPCRTSTLARTSPYRVFATMPAGMVAKTNARRKTAPNFDGPGVFASGRVRNQRYAR